MPLLHFTDRRAVQVLSTQSRRADISPYELSRSHIDLGRYLAHELLELLPVEPCEIAHPQGVRAGWRVAREADILILSLLRAGLYVTEGLREVLRHAAVRHAQATRARGLDDAELAAIAPLRDRRVIVVDSVINTGATLLPVLRQLAAQSPALIAVLSLVTPVQTAQALERDWPEVHFLFARISTNQYVGVGATDTGNRLFGTL